MTVEPDSTHDSFDARVYPFPGEATLIDRDDSYRMEFRTKLDISVAAHIHALNSGFVGAETLTKVDELVCDVSNCVFEHIIYYESVLNNDGDKLVVDIDGVYYSAGAMGTTTHHHSSPLITTHHHSPPLVIYSYRGGRHVRF